MRVLTFDVLLPALLPSSPAFPLCPRRIRPLRCKQAKKFLGERSPQYMTARSALRELKKLSNRLYKPRVPIQPTWHSPSDQNHLDAWKAYLAWENSNPLDLDDAAALQARQQHAHKQAIMHMRFFPEIWWVATRSLWGTHHAHPDSKATLGNVARQGRQSGRSARPAPKRTRSQSGEVSVASVPAL